MLVSVAAAPGGYPAGDLGAVAGGGGHVDGAAQCGQAVGDALQPAADRCGGGLETLAIVSDGEGQMRAVLAERHLGRRRAGVFRHVL